MVLLELRVVMFMDVHDFSLVMRELGTAQYDFVQAMYERLGDAVITHGGKLIKYLGDGMLCVFPAGAALDAVKCTLVLRQTYRNLVHEWNIAHPTELEVGLNMGEVAVGVFGHASLRQEDVFGEVVNEVAVIGHHRGVAVTEAVYTAIKDHYPTRALPDRTPKWRTTPLHVWEIVESSTGVQNNA
jgi:adenylate cyclase